MNNVTSRSPLSGIHTGMLAPEAYADIILSHDGVEACAICHYKTAPLLQERIQRDAFEERIIVSALKLHRETQIPFWHAVFISCLNEGGCTGPLLDAAGLHCGLGDTERISSDQIQAGMLSRVAAPGHANVGIGSEVRFRNGDALHLAVLDFRCPLSPANTQIVAAICRRLMPNGFMVLDSGDCYHGCGFALSTGSERVSFLARSLFYSPIVDSAYVAHQLLQSMSSIRISSGGPRGRIPEVVFVEGQPAEPT